MSKVAIFIDVQNVHITFEKMGQEVRYDVLLRTLLEDYKKRGKEIVKAIAFIPIFSGDERRERLVNALSFMGYRVVSKPVKKLADGSVKVSMDMDMALEILSIAEHVDEVVLITGDSDFVPIVDYLSRKGKRVRIIGTRKGAVGIELIRASDEYNNMDEFDNVLAPFRFSEESDIEDTQPDSNV
jgi:uncharacterized LabA/DUF88 family protein